MPGHGYLLLLGGMGWESGMPIGAFRPMAGVSRVRAFCSLGSASGGGLGLEAGASPGNFLQEPPQGLRSSILP